MDGSQNITRLENMLSQSGLTKLEDLHTAYLTFENWGDFLLNKFKIKSFEPKIREKGSIIDKRRAIIALPYQGKWVYFFYKGISVVDIYYTFAELFEGKDYENLELSDRTIIDIGAFVGDTAIYFALRGARHIYSFEPYPLAYNIAVKNIEMNKLQQKVSLFNEAVSNKKGRIRLKEDRANLGNRLEGSNVGKYVHIVTLDSICNRFLKEEKAVLKLDCEGYEYNIILDANAETLRKFDQILIEYHFGYLNLKKKLEECGFQVSHSMPRMLFSDKNVRIGLLWARLENR